MIKHFMGMRVVAVFIFAFAITVFYSPVFSDEFEDMMAGEMGEFDSQKQEFQSYQEQIASEFGEYKKIVDQEFKKYKKEILEHWDKPEVTGKKKFVEYSPDFKTKKVVDYENETIELNIIVPKGESQKKINKRIDNQLSDLLTENSKTAYNRDQLTQNIEKKLDKNVKNLKKSIVKGVPIIADALIGTATPIKQQVDSTVKKLRQTEKKTQKLAPKTADSEVVTVKIKLPSGTMAKKAGTYLNTVKKYAKKRKIDPALLLAVMQTESAFNPMARSYVPAYGLMQIVPRSAGLDASEFVFGKQKLLSPSYLYNGENNIRMGAAYLYILNYRYLKSIKNDTSRLYCVIAAYNTGAGNVARAFTGKTNIRKAAKKINAMSPEKVYKHLLRKLPHAETKHYVKNVRSRIKLYK